MDQSQWHSKTQRPLTRGDIGRFVVGYGVAGWVSGWVEEFIPDYLVVDTGRGGGPMGGNVVADVLYTYTFLDVPASLR